LGNSYTIGSLLCSVCPWASTLAVRRPSLDLAHFYQLDFSLFPTITTIPKPLLYTQSSWFPPPDFPSAIVCLSSKGESLKFHPYESISWYLSSRLNAQYS
jgi:hypothetical protein